MNNPCGKTELQLFDKQNVQVAAENGTWLKVYPQNPVNGADNTNPIEFNLPVIDTCYYDLNDTALYIKCKIHAPANSSAAPVNNLLGSIFEDVQLQLNDKLIEGGDFLYPYKAYITCMLNYGKDAKKAWLRASGYYKDIDGQFDAAENIAHLQRMSKMTKKDFFELMGPLHLSMFHQSKYLLPQTRVKLKLVRSNINFCINNFSETSKDEVKIEIIESWLRVRSVSVNSEIFRAHQTGLDLYNATYPIQKCQMSTFSIPKGVYSESKQILDTQCPKLLIIGFVSNQAFHGNNKHNPFNFKHYDCNFFALSVNGRDYPMEATKLDFSKGEYLVGYMNMIQNLEEYCKSDCNTTITAEGFAKGNTFFVFNFTPDLSYSASYGQQYRQSNFRLDVKFMKALPETINVVMYALYDGKIEITKDNAILAD